MRRIIEWIRNNIHVFSYLLFGSIEILLTQLDADESTLHRNRNMWMEATGLGLHPSVFRNCKHFPSRWNEIKQRKGKLLFVLCFGMILFFTIANIFESPNERFECEKTSIRTVSDCLSTKRSNRQMESIRMDNGNWYSRFIIPLHLRRKQFTPANRKCLQSSVLSAPFNIQRLIVAHNRTASIWMQAEHL